nr:hypothetical protein BaRGS_015676 [Batillaria attramentaria]
MGREVDVRCVVVGDDAVGKTSMLMGYATNRYPTQHVPAVFDNYAVRESVPETDVNTWSRGVHVSAGQGLGAWSVLDAGFLRVVLEKMYLAGLTGVMRVYFLFRHDSEGSRWRVMKDLPALANQMSGV